MLADSPVVDYNIKKDKKKGVATDYSKKNISEKAAEALRKFEESKNAGSDKLDSLNINGVKMNL